MARSAKRYVSSFRNTLILSMSIIGIPLFAAVALFGVYTVHHQRDAIRASRISTLSAYQAQLENAVQTAEAYLQDTVAANLDFQSIVYAKTKTEAYTASQTVAKTIRPWLQANDLMGGFYTYAKAFDYYRPSNIDSYPATDAAAIRREVIERATEGANTSGWQPMPLSDRTVLLNAAVFRGTAIAAVIDPGKQTFSGLEAGGIIFSVLQDGSLYAPLADLERVPIAQIIAGQIAFQDALGKKYDVVSLPLHRIGGHILYATPAVSPFEQLSVTQNILLLVALCLLASIPVCWFTFRRLWLEPLSSLTMAMQAIQNGDADIRVPQMFRVQEANEMVGTVNTMLDALQQLKIDSYEHRLATQHAQLQYFQMQMRPHFYLNCLTLIYSMVEEKNYAAIQPLVLDLSAYLRDMFRDSAKRIPLQVELRSVERYVRMQGAGVLQTPQLLLSIEDGAEEALIPPLSMLTFVENAFRHNKRTDAPLDIRIQCAKLRSEEGAYLNITIGDNGGGAPPEQLQALNHPPEEIYQEKHVGILNVRQRLRLLYGDKAAISFRNQADGLCVDLFLPMDDEGTGGDAE